MRKIFAATSFDLAQQRGATRHRRTMNAHEVIEPRGGNEREARIDFSQAPFPWILLFCELTASIGGSRHVRRLAARRAAPASCRTSCVNYRCRRYSKFIDGCCEQCECCTFFFYVFALPTCIIAELECTKITRIALIVIVVSDWELKVKPIVLEYPTRHSCKQARALHVGQNSTHGDGKINLCSCLSWLWHHVECTDVDFAGTRHKSPILLFQ